MAQDTGRGKCQFLKAWGLELDSASLPTNSLGRQNIECAFKRRRCRSHLSMGAVSKNSGSCFKIIIDRYSHFDAI